jgi:molybdopterin/thiamine biosynthesis adenylyltransferase
MMSNGYPPQDRVGQAGVDVLRISETVVMVAVDDVDIGEPWLHPAWVLCRALGALGFGLVYLRGAGAAGEEFSLLMQGFPFTLDDSPLTDAPPCDMVLHLGSDPDSREACARLAQSRSSQFASLSWRSSWVAMHSLEGVLRGAEARGRASSVVEEPLDPIARIASGLAFQEALIFAGQLEAAAPAAPLVCFDAASDTRRRQPGGSQWPDLYLQNQTLEVMGAGAVGTHLLESLAPMLGPGCELRIVDFDVVGPENLAIQPAFSTDDLGRPKAVVMAEKLAPLCDPLLSIRPLVMRYEDRPSDLSTPSLRIACPDSFAARKYANDCALADGVPLLEAGSAPLVAQQRSYLPGRTACLQHRIPNLAERAANEQDRASCWQDRAFTLPGTSMVCGGILAAETLRALWPEGFGWPSTGTIVYDARFPERFGVIEHRPPCSHQRSVKSGDCGVGAVDWSQQ